MNLRSLLNRRPTEQSPLLPAIEPDDRTIRRTPEVPSPRSFEERLERLLTPTELDLVQQHLLL